MGRRLRWPSSLTSAILLLALASPLPARAQSEMPEADAGVDPANAPYAEPAPVDPPTAEERLPVIDLSELPGVWPDEVVEAFPGTIDPASPEEAVAGATPLPSEGDATTDVFGVGDGTGAHIALIEAEPKNELGTDGTWTEQELALEVVEGGWAWSDPTGARFTFPEVLSLATPVLIETADGSISMAPTEEEGSSATGILDGASVTYPKCPESTFLDTSCLR